MKYNIEKANIKVLAIAEAPMPSTEICLLFPLISLQSKIFLDFDLIYEKDVGSYEHIDDVDIIIGLRCVRNSSVRFIINAKKKGIPFIFLLDDDFSSISPSNWLHSHYTSLGASDNIILLIKIANRVGFFSEELKKRYSTSNKYISILPVTDQTHDKINTNFNKNDSNLSENEFRIGYAGSPTHQEDIDLIRECLVKYANHKSGRFFIETIGQKIDALDMHPHYRHFDFIEGIESFFSFLVSRNWSIGLAPIKSNIMNNAKTDNKFRTYSLAGIPAIYSNVTPFISSVRNNETGIITDNSFEAWDHAISDLISNPIKRKIISKNAFNNYHVQYGSENVAKSYSKLIVNALNITRILVLVDFVDKHEPRNLNFLDHLELHNNVLSRFKYYEDVQSLDINWCDVVFIIEYTHSVNEISNNHSMLSKKPILIIKSDASDLNKKRILGRFVCNKFDNKSLHRLYVNIEEKHMGYDVVKAAVEILKEIGMEFHHA